MRTCSPGKAQAGTLDIQLLITDAKLGRSRKEAQEDTCSVFAAALYDILQAEGIACQMVTAHKRDGHAWAHAIVEVDGRYYDSMGEFSTDIYRQRARMHPAVALQIEYLLDTRDECFEEEFDELHAFYLKKLATAANSQTPAAAKVD